MLIINPDIILNKTTFLFEQNYPDLRLLEQSLDKMNNRVDKVLSLETEFTSDASDESVFKSLDLGMNQKLEIGFRLANLNGLVFMVSHIALLFVFKEILCL